jgi:uncharacterized protein YndB with AHSA1/START domain
MPKLFQVKRINGVSDYAVQAKTGRKWDEWFKVLDKAGARMMDHKEIAQLAQSQLGLTPWWSQLVIVGYEHDRGIRQKHQRGTRFDVDRSRTIAAPIDAVWAAWHDEGALASWLPGAVYQISKTTPNRILHLIWPDDTRVVVVFSEKSGKTRVVVSHEKLQSTDDVERMQAYWSDALDRLKALVTA